MAGYGVFLAICLFCNCTVTIAQSWCTGEKVPAGGAGMETSEQCSKALETFPGTIFFRRNQSARWGTTAHGGWRVAEGKASEQNTVFACTHAAKRGAGLLGDGSVVR